MKSTLGLLGTAFILSVAAFAAPGSGMGVDRLARQGQELERAVRYSNLSGEVLSSVQRFNDEVRTLDYCSSRNDRSDFLDLRPGFGGGRPGGGGHGGGWPGGGGHGGGGHGGGNQCQGQMNRVERSFDLLARYLRGTQFQYPQVFQEFQQTRRALRALLGDDGGPVQPVTVRCVAVDNGWEEHFGGHVGFGRNVVEAQRVALATCQSTHGSCRIQSCGQ